MFRITAENEGNNKKVLFLEGKLCQECVKELQSEIQGILDLGQEVVLDFSKVTFLHSETADVLSRFPSNKVTKRKCSLYVRSMLNLKERG
ncbi:hypothetical protein ACFLT9_07680 [Acidobacteriota bacterium]